MIARKRRGVKLVDSSKPNAFLVLRGRQLGGMERRLARLALHLNQSGSPTVLYTSREALKALEGSGIHFPQSNVKYLDTPLITRLLGLRFSLQVGLFTKLILAGARRRARQIHICHDPGKLSSTLLRLSALLPPISLTVADSRHNYPANALPPLRFAKAIDCLSQDIADELLKKVNALGASGIGEAIAVAPCSFIEHSEGGNSSHVDRDIDVVFAARFTKGKGLELLSSMAELPSSLNIHVLGEPVDGPESVEPLVQGAKIYFANDLPAILRRARVFLSLQEQENYPSQSLLEAMSSACAVIATDVGLTRRLVDDSCGRLVQNSPTELRAAIIELSSDPLLTETLGQAGRKKVRVEHTVERFSSYFQSQILDSERRHLAVN